jgi:hypothetical protein
VRKIEVFLAGVIRPIEHGHAAWAFALDSNTVTKRTGYLGVSLRLNENQIQFKAFIEAAKYLKSEGLAGHPIEVFCRNRTVLKALLRGRNEGNRTGTVLALEAGKLYSEFEDMILSVLPLGKANLAYPSAAHIAMQYPKPSQGAQGLPAKAA